MAELRLEPGIREEVFLRSFAPAIEALRSCVKNPWPSVPDVDHRALVTLQITARAQSTETWVGEATGALDPNCIKRVLEDDWSAPRPDGHRQVAVRVVFNVDPDLSALQRELEGARDDFMAFCKGLTQRRANLASLDDTGEMATLEFLGARGVKGLTHWPRAEDAGRPDWQHARLNPFAKTAFRTALKASPRGAGLMLWAAAESIRGQRQACPALEAWGSE